MKTTYDDVRAVWAQKHAAVRKSHDQELTMLVMRLRDFMKPEVLVRFVADSTGAARLPLFRTRADPRIAREAAAVVGAEVPAWGSLQYLGVRRQFCLLFV